MKKNLWKVLLCLALVVTLVTCLALADAAPLLIKKGTGATVIEADGTFSVSVTSSKLIPGNQYVLMMVKLTSMDYDDVSDLTDGVAVDTLASSNWSIATDGSNINYIDQKAATGNGDGTVAFTDTDAFIPKSTAPSVLLLGGTFNGATSPLPIGVVASSGVSVKGQVTSYKVENPTTITLTGTGSTSGTYTGTIAAAEHDDGPVTQEFTVESVPDGTYDLTVSKKNYLTLKVTGVVVNGEELDLAADSSKDYAELRMICGEFTDDGMVNFDDLFELLDANNYDQDYDDVVNKDTDINGDEMVNFDDLFFLLDAENYDLSEDDIEIEFN